MNGLEDIWKTLCSRYSKDDGLIEKLWEEIESQYSTKNRHYHTLGHIQFMVELARKHQEIVSDMETLLFSTYYHDIIYKALRKDNEEKSAQLAQIRLHQLGVPSQRINKCAHQILATKHHQSNNDNDTKIFLDLDLAILGSSSQDYKNYSRQIRKEFSFYPNFIYRLGRKKVLKYFLNKEYIYHTNEFRKSFEEQSIKNIENELAGL